MLEAQDPQGSLVGVTLGNYRVTDRIGAGGMGVVYRAQDLRLGRVVAVKALPHAAESDPDGRRKLMNEARRASRVVSPYVATVFDVVEQDDSAYIVMEYIEGRRLDDVLRHDRPGIALVTGYAIEIAEALTAIHSAGLVHRDLKPANVMVTPTGHVKVMDFGLAREDAAALLREAGAESTLSTQTAPGVIAGTILYMSPEQVRGEALDARSDLFSFGTLLHEAVTGKHPFERETILASASAILNEPPAGGFVAPQASSDPIGTIVHRLLEKDRDSRYPSAELVMNDLRAAQTGAAIAAMSDPATGRKRFWLIATSSAALATITLIVSTVGPSRAPVGGVGTRPVIAVLPFEDRTGEPRGDLRGQLLAELIATDFADSSYARAIPSDRVRDVLVGIGAQAPRSAALAAVAKAVDVKWIVAGDLYKENDAQYASVGVYGPGRPDPIVSFRADAGTTAAIAEIASAKLRGRLFPDRKDALPAAGKRAVGGSTSEEAQLLEQEAKRAVRERRYGEAIDKLDKAVRLDPGFLAAQVHLADALDRAGYGTRARETADRASRIVEQTGDAARNESLVLEAQAVRAHIHRDADAEIAARRALVARQGDDPSAHLALATALETRGRSTEALPEADLAIALDPKDPAAHLAKARSLSRSKRFEEASVELDRAEALFKGFGSAVGQATIARARADADYAQARYPQAADAYQRAATTLDAAGLPVLAAQCRKGAGDCELKQGKLDAAIAIYNRVLAIAGSAGDHRTIVGTLSSLGGQYQVRGDLVRAEETLREARGAGADLDNPRLLDAPTLNLASVLASSGRRGESRALAEEALGMARDSEDYEVQSKALLLLANADYNEGRIDEAIRGYRDVLNSAPLANAPGTPVGNIHLGLADIFREAGRLKEAANSADSAVSFNRASPQPALLGYSLVARARVRADLGLDAGATADLDEAEKLASDSAAPLASVRRGAGLGRAALDINRFRWDDAERALAALRNEPGSPAGVAVLAMSARVATEVGRAQDAIRYAERATSEPTASVVDRTKSRVLLARAYARAANRPRAASEARRGLDEADRMGLSFESALACAVLVELGDGGDTAAIRARGQKAIEQYLDAAPEERREALRSRGDLKSMIRVLEKVSVTNKPARP